MARDDSTSGTACRRAGAARVLRARRGVVAALWGVLALGAVAVGGFMASTPVGAVAPTPGWTTASTPAPTGPDTPGANPNATWASVSCVSAVFCAGAGKYSGTDSDLPLLGLEIDGTWTTQEAPLPSNATDNTTARLTSVSCPAVGSCVAVGFYSDTTGGFSQHALVETLSGGSWSPQDAPVPSDGLTASPYDALLQSVDCTTVQACVAIGSYKGTGGQRGLIDTESGGTWSALVAPQPTAADADQQVSVSDVACPALGPCAATGSYEAGSMEFPTAEPFLLQQSAAGSWSAEDAPLPEGSNTGDTVSNQVSGVSCAAAVCEAVGQVEMATNQDVGLLEQLSNGSWTPSAAPLPSNTGTGGAGLNAVSCTFDGICTAVGSYNNAVNGGLPLIDTVHGATVTATEGPQPTDTATGSGSAGTLNAVSCLSGTDCAAVGYYRNSTNSGMDAALTLTLTGGTWSAPTIALPAGAGTGSSASSILSSVSCTTRGTCETVGNYADTAQNGFGLVEGYVPPEGYWSVASDGGIFNYGPERALLRLHGRPASQRPDGGHGGDARRRGLLGGGRRRRRLQLRQRHVPRLDGQPAPERPHRRHGRHPGRRWLLAGGLRRRHLQLRRRAVVRLGGIAAPQQARRRHGRDPRRARLLARRLRRRHLQLRRRRLLRLAGRPAAQHAHRRHDRQRGRGTATGSSPPTAASSATATPRSGARPAPWC